MVTRLKVWGRRIGCGKRLQSMVFCRWEKSMGFEPFARLVHGALRSSAGRKPRAAFLAGSLRFYGVDETVALIEGANLRPKSN